MFKQLFHEIFGCTAFWVYKNKFDRTCSMCHKHQQKFGTLLRNDKDAGSFWEDSWWEDVQ